MGGFWDDFWVSKKNENTDFEKIQNRSKKLVFSKKSEMVSYHFISRQNRFLMSFVPISTLFFAFFEDPKFALSGLSEISSWGSEKLKIVDFEKSKIDRKNRFFSKSQKLIFITFLVEKIDFQRFFDPFWPFFSCFLRPPNEGGVHGVVISHSRRPIPAKSRIAVWQDEISKNSKNSQRPQTHCGLTPNRFLADLGFIYGFQVPNERHTGPF